ncbi:hypothetical protein BJ878DRAFT_53195 [Calycina marina]|uniref:SP-RING-type domain-containing protein n=1 Tax=Calycina marina TaxID=1763456 RepID=A0A9P7Z3S7_9HELO|nr:hypothetical protein BJ878DRAFT_53195 [Calycina marina]
MPQTNSLLNMTASIRAASHDRVYTSPYIAAMAPPTILQSQSLVGPSPTFKNSPTGIPPAKRQRTQPPAMPSLRQKIPLIQQHVASTGGALIVALERPRFSLIEQACREDDTFYIALHQLFCVWDVHHQSLPNLPYLLSAQGLIPGFRVLAQLIKPNAELTPVHLVWFSNFPSPLESLLMTSAPYRGSIAAAREFLSRIGLEWDKLSERCRQRGFPPIVDELVGVLGCLSPILQQIIFTASRRNLGFDDEAFGPRMEEIFRDDRSTHRALSQRMNTASPPTEKEVVKRNDELMNAYLKVRQQRLQALANQNTMNGGRPSPSHPKSRTPTPVVPRNLNSMSQPYNQSMAWQQGQTSGPGTAPISVNSRPSSGHCSAGTLSPTLLQNLSMNAPGHASPIQNPTQNAGQYQSQVEYSYPTQYTPQITPQQAQPHIQHVQNIHQQAAVQASLANQMQGYNQQSEHAAYLNMPQQQYLFRQQQLALQRNQQAQLNGSVPFNPRSGPRQRQYPIPSPQVQTKVETWVKTNPLERSLVPPTGYVIPAQPIVPDITALHQAHVRSPKLGPADLAYSGRFYQAIKGFALGPIKYPFTGGNSFIGIEFSLQPEDWAMLAKEQPSEGDKLPKRLFRKGTTQFRFRCIQSKDITAACLLSEWVISDTTWPEHIFASLNSEPIELRRKPLHGKDQPVDITAMIRKNNDLKISISKSKSRPKYFFIAVEVVEILQHDQILEMCKLDRIQMETTLASIKKALALVGDDDDEMTMEVTDLTIDITDPFMSRIFEVPVRSVNCRHRECFDLETFLQTRNSKPKRPGAPCMIDQWKCPLCGKDARPYNLRIDDFLVSVRAKLEQDNSLDVKTILVKNNGDWRPKLETKPRHRTGGKRIEHDEDSSDEEATKSAKANGDHTSVQGLSIRASDIRAQRPEPQVIDLDSD